MRQFLPFVGEAAGTVRHLAAALGDADFLAQIGLA